MKKILSFLLLGCMCVGCMWGQTSTVSGVWNRKQPADLKVCQINNGATSEVATAKVKENEEFCMSFVPQKEGYYALNYGRNKYYMFYLKPGDNFQIEVTPESYRLAGKNNTPENKEMVRWHDFICPLDNMTWPTDGKRYTYVEFFPALDSKVGQLRGYKAKKTKNRAFDASFADFRNIDLLYNALIFVFTPHSAQPKDTDFIDYYRNVNLPDLTKNTAVLGYPDGMRLVLNSYLLKTKILKNGEEDDAIRTRMQNPAKALLELDKDQIANDTLKGEIALTFMSSNKTFLGLENYKKSYARYLVTDEQKDRFLKFEKAFVEKQNAATADFKFPDINGKEHALSDYKGKVVYIDVWATWCGPCKRELPFLKKLEAEYKDNKDIVFIGVSVDNGKSEDKWKEFITKEQLPGIQLFSGDSSQQILKPYKITGIPRFLLVGKDGKMIYTDAPRPSSSEVRAVINKALE